MNMRKTGPASRVDYIGHGLIEDHDRGHKMSAEIFKLSDAAFRLASPIGGALVLTK